MLSCAFVSFSFLSTGDPLSVYRETRFRPEGRT